MIKMLQPSFARIGYIKLGGRGGKGGMPVKFDHFEIRSTQKGPDDNFLPDTRMMERLGPHPTSLKIRLPFNDIDLVFSTMLAYYRGNNRYCWGDGETAQRLSGAKSGESKRFGPAQPFGPCGETCPDFQERRCKPMGALQVILEDQQQIGGAYLFKTTSWNSIRNISTALAAIKAQTGGILAWVPLTMRVGPQVVQPKDGSPANTAYIVQITFDGSPEQLLTTVRDLLSIRAPLIQELRALEAGLKALPAAEEEADEAEDTQAEFYPDLAEAGPQGAMESDTAPVTSEEVETLLAFLLDVYQEKELVRQHLRVALTLDASAPLGKKWLAHHLTRPIMTQLRDAAEVTLRATLAAQDMEDDEDVFGEPSQPQDDEKALAGVPVGEISPQREGVESHETSEAILEDTRVDAEPLKPFATPAQLGALKTLAQQVSDEAYADVLDIIDHYRQQLPLNVCELITSRLEARKQAKV